MWYIIWSNRALFEVIINLTFVKCRLLGKGSTKKKRFLSGIARIPQTPPPWPEFGQLGPLFSEVEIQDLKVSLELKILYILYNILYICNLKTVKSSIHWHFWRNRLFLLTKNALLKRGPKNSGMGRPPPHNSGNARKKTFFFQLRSSLRVTFFWRHPLALLTL